MAIRGFILKFEDLLPTATPDLVVLQFSARFINSLNNAVYASNGEATFTITDTLPNIRVKIIDGVLDAAFNQHGLAVLRTDVILPDYSRGS